MKGACKKKILNNCVNMKTNEGIKEGKENYHVAIKTEHMKK